MATWCPPFPWGRPGSNRFAGWLLLVIQKPKAMSLRGLLPAKESKSRSLSANTSAGHVRTSRAEKEHHPQREPDNGIPVGSLVTSGRLGPVRLANVGDSALHPDSFARYPMLIAFE